MLGLDRQSLRGAVNVAAKREFARMAHKIENDKSHPLHLALLLNDLIDLSGKSKRNLRNPILPKYRIQLFNNPRFSVMLQRSFNQRVYQYFVTLKSSLSETNFLKNISFGKQSIVTLHEC